MDKYFSNILMTSIDCLNTYCMAFIWNSIAILFLKFGRNYIGDVGHI